MRPKKYNTKNFTVYHYVYKDGNEKAELRSKEGKILFPPFATKEEAISFAKKYENFLAIKEREASKN